MDPISAITTIIGLVAVALHSTRRIIEFIDGIQGAPQAVKALSRDLSALEQVLQTLNDVVSHPGFQSNTRPANLAALLQDPLDNCALALEDISLAIRPYTKPSGDSRKSKWRGFTWSFREKEIITLQRMLMSYKSSLTMAVAVANLSTTSAGFSDTQKQIRGLQQHLDVDSRSVADSSYQGSEAIGSDPGFTLRRYLFQSDQNPSVSNEIDGQQIYEMGSNFSESLDRVDDGFRKSPTRPQTNPGPSSSGTESKSLEESDQNIQELEPPVVLTNQVLDGALSTLRPNLSETFELKALGPTFGIDLEMLYRRDGVFIPRAVQYCVAIAEQVCRQTSNLYDLEADTYDVTYLKDRFDNGRPVQVSARAVFDHCTVDPRKLSFSKGDEILVLEPRDEKWFLGRRQDTTGLLPIDFVQFSVKDIANIVGTCKAFFMDLPNSLIPKLQYDSLIKAAGTESAGDRLDRINTTTHELPLPHLELLKFMILHLRRISVPHSENGTTAMDLARPWAPILMRRSDESAVAEKDQELQVRVVQTLIASAEEVFEADPTEKYADPSFSSVTLMPNVRPSVTSESDHARTQSLPAFARPFRSFWPAKTTYVIGVISKCTEIIESNGWKSQIYSTDASQSEVIRARFSLTTGSGLKPAESRYAAPGPFAVATLLKNLIAANPNPLMALEDIHWDTVTELVSRSSTLSTKDGFRGRALIRRTEHYEILKTIMLHLCRISEKCKNAFSLAQTWTPILTQKEGSRSEQRDLYELVQGMIMNAYEFFEEPKPQAKQPTIYELE